MDGVTLFAAFITVIGATVTAVMTYTRTKTSISSELLASYKARDDLADKERKENKEQINSLTAEVGRLRGVIEEKDRRIGVYEATLQNRNPELISVLGEIKEFMKKINDHMDEHTKAMVKGLSH